MAPPSASAELSPSGCVRTPGRRRDRRSRSLCSRCGAWKGRMSPTRTQDPARKAAGIRLGRHACHSRHSVRRRGGMTENCFRVRPGLNVLTQHLRTLSCACLIPYVMICQLFRAQSCDLPCPVHQCIAHHSLFDKVLALDQPYTACNNHKGVRLLSVGVSRPGCWSNFVSWPQPLVGGLAPFLA